jgi:dsRNA-specific ribonuclease
LIVSSIILPITPTAEEGELKSPISWVHEAALRRGLGVQFEVVGESGPPHMRTFITACIVGATRCQGEGASKKVIYLITLLFVFILLVY